MSRFNTRNLQAKPAVTQASSPMSTTSKQTPDTFTHNGAAGWAKTPQTELFLRLTAAFSGGQKSFYESAENRDGRLVSLTHKLAVEDPEFVFELARWARTEGNIRTGALMVAAEFAKARLDAGLHGRAGTRVGQPDKQWAEVTSRSIIDAVLERADEPGEMIAYWHAVYGRRIPKPVKRGIADAVRRLYTERSLLKYDTASHSIRFGDVLELTHAAPRQDATWQGDLFKFALDRRHGNDEEIPASLGMLQLNRELYRTGDFNRWFKPETLKAAGITWEDMLSHVGPRTQKKRVWEAIIPSMSHMALLRNLRNFDEAGVSDEVAQQVITRISTAEEVAKGRQFPFRYLAAYQHAPSLRWSYPLEQALGHSLANVPALGGRTLIMVDRSGSMFGPMSDRSKLTLADSAAIFGSALALRAQSATLVQFGTRHAEVPFRKGESVLRLLQKFSSLGGTNTVEALRSHYNRHDRVVIVTDEQASYSHLGTVSQQVPAHIPVYTWNLAGYAQSQMPSGSEARFLFGGLTDKAFTMIPLIEAGRDGSWPWSSAQ